MYRGSRTATSAEVRYYSHPIAVVSTQTPNQEGRVPLSERHPVEIEVTPERELAVTWNDGHRTAIRVDALRDFCACATCRKARMDREEAAQQPRRRSLNVLGAATRYDIEGLEHVGRYGLGVNWKDAHRSIYTYEYLASLCPCEDCTAARGGPPVPFDPIVTG
jgi:DUF971 family protein